MFRSTRLASSNYGDCVDISAPGEQIWSAWIGETDSGKSPLSGTSVATPFVTGAAALYLQSNVSATPSTVKEALQESSLLDLAQEIIDDGHVDLESYVEAHSPVLVLTIAEPFLAPVSASEGEEVLDLLDQTLLMEFVQSLRAFLGL